MSIGLSREWDVVFHPFPLGIKEHGFEYYFNVAGLVADMLQNKWGDIGVTGTRDEYITFHCDFNAIPFRVQPGFDISMEGFQDAVAAVLIALKAEGSLTIGRVLTFTEDFK